MELEAKKFYRVLAPRPVALITTVDVKGNVNAAPFSFVMPVSMLPPLLVFASCPGRDTLENIRDTKEFVVNVPTEDILNEVWKCSEDFPKGVNELKESGLTEIKSKKVKPPRVGECLGWFECTLEFEKEAGDHVLVVGKVLCAEVKDGLLTSDGNLDVEKAKVLMHLGGVEFSIPKTAIRVS